MKKNMLSIIFVTLAFCAPLALRACTDGGEPQPQVKLEVAQPGFLRTTALPHCLRALATQGAAEVAVQKLENPEQVVATLPFGVQLTQRDVCEMASAAIGTVVESNLPDLLPRFGQPVPTLAPMLTALSTTGDVAALRDTDPIVGRITVGGLCAATWRASEVLFENKLLAPVLACLTQRVGLRSARLAQYPVLKGVCKRAVTSAGTACLWGCWKWLNTASKTIKYESVS